MIVSLVTTRLVLDILQIDNYGIYKAVNGIAFLFGFIGTSFTTTTKRFFAISIAQKQENRLSDIFNIAIKCFITIAILTIIIEESAGLWMLNNKMQIPQDKENLAFFVFHITILTYLINTIRLPFEALIMANEKFKFYSYTSIIETILQLGIVILLTIQPYDVAYAYITMQVATSAIMLTWYISYCKRHFNCVHLKQVDDKSIFKEMFNFTKWSIWGTIANYGVNKAIVVLINIFYGVGTNAAFAIADRICDKIEKLFKSFHTAFTPQLTKAQAIKAIDEQEILISQTTRISFFLVFVTSIPVLCNIDYLLEIWLNEVPTHTASICQLLIVAMLVKVVSDPIRVTILATGKIKHFQIADSLISISSLIIIYLFFKQKHPIEHFLAIRIVEDAILFVNRLHFVKTTTDISIRPIACDIIKILTISMTTAIASFILINNFQGLNRLLVSVPILITLIIGLMYSIGTNKEEKQIIKLYAKTKLQQS